MGDLRLAYEQRDGRSLVFALLPTGQAVWGMDAATRQEWWYTPELADAVLPDLRAALQAQPTGVPEAPPVGPGTDLASQLPGHAVLAQIEAQHRAATTSVIDGIPGTLDDGIVAWCVGYVGEAAVGTQLARLGPSWRVLHAVPVGTRGSDIDHVVLGPSGVFTINTKHHAGVRVDVKGDSVFVGRDYQHYVRNARKDAARAQSVIAAVAPSLGVRGLVVTVGATLRVKQPPTDVTVLDSSSLVPWLLSQPVLVSDADVVSIFDYARWSGRWTTTPPPPAAAAWVDGFARQMATEQAVAKASRRRSRAAGSPPAPLPATRTRPTAKSAPQPRKKRRRSVMPDLARLAAGILLFAFLVKVAPMLITSFTQSLSTPRPATTSTPAVVAKAGAACPTRGATAVTSVGAPLVCSAGAGSARLVWQPRK